MIFNKYVIAIGVALSFLMTSLNAQENASAECPVNKDRMSKNCAGWAKKYNTLSESDISAAIEFNTMNDDEKSNLSQSESIKRENNYDKVENYKKNFEGTAEKQSPCQITAVNGEEKINARCEKYKNKTSCENEPTACRWSESRETCEKLKIKDIKFECLGQ